MSLIIVACVDACGAALAAEGDALPGLPSPNGPGPIYPLQGDPGSFPTTKVPVQRDLATISYPGISATANMLQVYGDCVYIDNYSATQPSHTAESYFVPLKTAQEWDAFKANHPADVAVVPGCPAFSGPVMCGNSSFDMVVASPHRGGEVFPAPADETYGAANFTLQCVIPNGATCGYYVGVSPCP